MNKFHVEKSVKLVFILNLTKILIICLKMKCSGKYLALKLMKLST